MSIQLSLLFLLFLREYLLVYLLDLLLYKEEWISSVF